MEKHKYYDYACFNADVLKTAIQTVFPSSQPIKSSALELRRGNETWVYDDELEFYSDYRKDHDTSSVYLSDYEKKLIVNYNKFRYTSVKVTAKTRGEIESIFEIFERHYESSINEPDDKENILPIIFIGHGRSMQWRDLKDHLADKHGYKIEAYETGARAGHTIRDILEEMVTKSSFALLVMTGEDENKSGIYRARQNVVHEIGLFQGRLGFARAIVLLEEGTEEFSNLFGIQQIRFGKNNIKETFGEVLATIRREFYR